MVCSGFEPGEWKSQTNHCANGACPEACIFKLTEGSILGESFIALWRRLGTAMLFQSKHNVQQINAKNIYLPIVTILYSIQTL